MKILRQGFRKLRAANACVFTSGHMTKMARSHHSIRCSQKPHVHADFTALSVIEPDLWAIEDYIAGNRHCRPFCSCDLDLDKTSYTNLTRIRWRYTGYANVNVLRHAVESYRLTDIQTDRQVRRDHFWPRDKDGSHTIRSAVLKNHMLHAKLMAVFVRTGVISD